MCVLRAVIGQPEALDNMLCAEYLVHARYRKDAWAQDDYAQQPANDGGANKDDDMNDPNTIQHPMNHTI